MLINVRFFTYCINSECDADVVECSENTFKSLKGAINYERHTVFANGVNQVCLTVEPNDYPDINEVKL